MAARKARRPPRRTRRSAQVHARARSKRSAKASRAIAAPPEDQQARTVKAQTAFLRAFAERGIVRRACDAAKVGRRTVYDWRASDERFQQLYAEAQQDADDQLEDEAVRRASVGWLEPVFQGGEQIGSIRKYSDSLLITMLKARKPDVYRERFEHSGPKGGPIEHSIVLKNAKESLLKKLETLAGRAAAGEVPAGTRKRRS